MPIPVKRYVEHSDSSESSSDDESSSPVSQNTSQLTDDSQLEVIHIESFISGNTAHRKKELNYNSYS